ncbi:cell division protein PerM, partial [Streptomyces lonarensis]
MSALFVATVAAVRSLPARLRGPRHVAENATADPGAPRAAGAPRPGPRPDHRPHDGAEDDPDEPGGRRTAGSCAAEGLVAAGLGAGALAVLVLSLWTVSPHPDDGPGNATTLAVDLWLLAHGAALVRNETLGGAPAPIGITPLLLALVPGWLLRRAVRVTLPVDSGPGRALSTALWITVGYLAAAAVGVLYTLDGPISVDPLGAAVAVPLFALVVTVTAGWSHTGPPLLPGRAQWLQETDAPRAAAAGLAAMCGAGTVLAAVALVGHAGAAQSLFGQLAGDWSGRISLLLLGCALVPNAAVWAAAYGLGPGFTVGGGVALAPLASGGDDPRLPPFPLLAALPGEGGTPLTLGLAALVPLTAVAVTAVFLGRATVPVRADRTTATSAGDTACAAVLAAALLGLGAGVLALLAGGAMGTGDLAEFGPVPWQVGVAAFGWVAVLGTPAALLARAWRLRREDFARSVAHEGAQSARGLAARGRRAVVQRVPRPQGRGARTPEAD